MNRSFLTTTLNSTGLRSELLSKPTKNLVVDELSKLLGRGRAKKGMFEGDMVEGELEIGQVAALIREIKSAKAIIDEIVAEYNQAKATLKNI